MKRQLHNSLIPEEDDSIDLTPLIDVVFVVLIAFIIIAPMLEIDTIDLASSKTELDDKRSLHTTNPSAIYVHADNTIWLGKRQIGLEQLESNLQKLQKEQKTQELQVFHDQKAQFGIYQRIKNAAEKTGFKQLDIILKPS